MQSIANCQLLASASAACQSGRSQVERLSPLRQSIFQASVQKLSFLLCCVKDQPEKVYAIASSWKQVLSQTQQRHVISRSPASSLQCSWPSVAPSDSEALFAAQCAAITTPWPNHLRRGEGRTSPPRFHAGSGRARGLGGPAVPAVPQLRRGRRRGPAEGGPPGGRCAPRWTSACVAGCSGS